MANDIRKVLDVMLVLIPDDYKSDIANSTEFATRGILEMGIALGEEFRISYQDELVENDDGSFSNVYVPVSCSPELNSSQIYLASYFAYRCYLLKLKDEFNRDAINFKTLTFEIKSLEKRPEAINDTIYSINRYLDSEVAKVVGSTSLIGKVQKFGGAK